MDLGLAGRKAIVCASSRGLGKACASALAEAGCVVTINGRDAARLAETAKEIRAASMQVSGSSALTWTIGISNPLARSLA